MFFFFFNDTATTEIYTFPYTTLFRSRAGLVHQDDLGLDRQRPGDAQPLLLAAGERSEEHTSELQSPCNLVCRLLLEKKKNEQHIIDSATITDGTIVNNNVHQPDILNA